MEFQLAHPRARAGSEQGQLGTGQKTRDGWAALARGERSRGGRSLPTGVPGIGGPGFWASPMRWPLAGHPLHRVCVGRVWGNSRPLCFCRRAVPSGFQGRRGSQTTPLGDGWPFKVCVNAFRWRWFRHLSSAGAGGGGGTARGSKGAEPQTESNRHRVQSTQARPSQRTTVGHGASAAANDRRAKQASNCLSGMQRRRLT